MERTRNSFLVWTVTDIPSGSYENAISWGHWGGRAELHVVEDGKQIILELRDLTSSQIIRCPISGSNLSRAQDSSRYFVFEHPKNSNQYLGFAFNERTESASFKRQLQTMIEKKKLDISLISTSFREVSLTPRLTLNTIPNELILLVFSFLNAKELCILRQVNHRFKELVDDPLVWRQLYMKLSGVQNSQTSLIMRLSPLCLGSGGSSSNILGGIREEEGLEFYYNSSYFRERYSWKQLTAGLIGWNRSTYTHRQLTGHNYPINCLQMDDEVLVTGSGDLTMRVWDLKDGKCIQKLVGHRKGINCLRFDNRYPYLVSGARDGIRTWNMITGQEISYLCKSRIINNRTMELNNHILLYASEHSPSGVGKVEVWDVSKGLVLQTLSHGEHSNCVKWVDGQVASGGCDSRRGRWHIWDLEYGMEIMSNYSKGSSILFSDPEISCLEFNHQLLISATDRNVRVWDRNSGKEIFSVSHERRKETSLQVVSDFSKFVVSSGECALVWDVRSNKSLFKLQNTFPTSLPANMNPNVITCLQIDDTKTVCGATGGISVFNLSTGKQTHFLPSRYPTTCLQFDPMKMISANTSYENSAEVWDFSKKPPETVATKRKPKDEKCSIM